MVSNYVIYYNDSSIVQIFSSSTKRIPVPALFIPIPDLEKWNYDFTFQNLALKLVLELKLAIVMKLLSVKYVASTIII